MLTAVVEFDPMHEGYDYERLFPLITCPVLIIQGSSAHGGMLTSEEIEHALTLLPYATVARMETVGHPFLTHPGERAGIACHDRIPEDIVGTSSKILPLP